MNDFENIKWQIDVYCGFDGVVGSGVMPIAKTCILQGLPLANNAFITLTKHAPGYTQTDCTIHSLKESSVALRQSVSRPILEGPGINFGNYEWYGPIKNVSYAVICDDSEYVLFYWHLGECRSIDDGKILNVQDLRVEIY